MILQDGKEGGDQDTAVGMPQDHRNHGHVDIQQQIIMTVDGVRMQVVRVVSFGGSRGGDDIPSQIQEQIRNIENALMGEIANVHEVDKENDNESKPVENEAEEEKHETPDEKKAEEEDKYDRDINPRGKVLQGDFNKENEEEENSNQDKPDFINDKEKESEGKYEDNMEKELGSFQSKIESLQKDISVAEHAIEKVQEIAENENIENKVKIKVLDVEPETSTESSEDDDYDVVHSKTKRIKIEGIPNQAKKPDPPKSIFKNLGPSRQRYTILEKDELWYIKPFNTTDFISLTMVWVLVHILGVELVAWN